MTKVQLFIATTIDGFIARENGSLDWLFNLPNPNQIDHGYGDFISGIDTVVLGRKTYEDILGFGIEWPYGNCTSYIVTNNSNYSVSTDNTLVLNELNKSAIELLRSKSSANIWVVGGGEIISRFLNCAEIDEMILSIIPIILGKGISLFPGEPKETEFELIRSEAFETGVVNLSYRRKVQSA
jgi:dihydrofolate reductase